MGVGNAMVYYLFPKQNVVSEIGYLLKNAFEKILADKSKWIPMGKLSGKLYDEIFNRKIVVENFIERMNKFSVEKKCNETTIYRPFGAPYNWSVISF